MYKAVIINSDDQHPLPTAKEIKNYLNKTGKLLYGNDKRKSVNTPFQNTIHLVMNAFNEFEEAITGRKRDFFTPSELYVFDDKVNEMHFFLKYAGQIQCHFNLDDAIIDKMHHCTWSHGHLKRHKQSVEQNANSSKFYIEKSIGNTKFHKAFPKFTKASNDYIAKIDDAMKIIEADAISLYKTGW